MDRELVLEGLHPASELGDLRGQIFHRSSSLGARLWHARWTRARAAGLALALLVALTAGCRGRSRGTCQPDPPPGVLGTVCGFQNPEDVEAVPSAGIVVVSELRYAGAGGALAALTLGAVPVSRRLWPLGETPGAVAPPPVAGDPSCTSPPAAAAFAPHGITSAPLAPGMTRIAVVGHEPAREAIELFDLEGVADGARLTWRGCVPLPAGTVGNDLAIAPDGEIVVSNFAPSLAPLSFLYAQLKASLGRATGDLIAWNAQHGWRHIPGTAAPLPNGVAVSPDGGAVYYAETGSGEFARVSRTGGAPTRRAVPGRPDNLAWSRRGTLLAGTHTDGAALLLCFLGRRPCRTGWSLLEIDPRTLEATELLHDDGSVLGAVASATEVDGRVYLGAVFDDRLGVWRPGAGR
jgi:hypothetical protein